MLLYIKVHQLVSQVIFILNNPHFHFPQKIQQFFESYRPT